MFLFDELINKFNNLNSSYNSISLSLDLSRDFKENNNQIIFNNEKAFELGGGKYKGITIDFPSDETFDDGIFLIGDDIKTIKSDRNYARICLVSIDKDLMGKGNSLYSNLRKIDYVKYHFSLDGLMIRESAFAKKESIVFSKNTIKKEDVDFGYIGSYMISKYKALPFVKNVKLIFIDLEQYPYEMLAELVKKTDDIIKALDHLTNKVNMDCHSCSLQVVCNEVEKKVNEDFKK